MNINFNTKIYCIFGNPVKHSLSPIMHNSAFSYQKINALYHIFEINSIKDGINAMKILNIKGASVTIPFKIDVLNYLDEIDPLAKLIGAVNTIKNSNGRMFGYNTDGPGAIKALKEKLPDISNKNFLILGNGGAARAIIYSILMEKGSVTVAGRNLSKLEILQNEIKQNGYEIKIKFLEKLNSKIMKNIDVIINTTPLGMGKTSQISPIDIELIKKKHILFDIIYSPDVTKFLDAGIAKGCTVVKGAKMLLYQGVLQFELWNEQEAPVNVMEKSLMENLTL